MSMYLLVTLSRDISNPKMVQALRALAEQLPAYTSNLLGELIGMQGCVPLEDVGGLLDVTLVDDVSATDSAPKVLLSETVGTDWPTNWPTMRQVLAIDPDTPTDKTWSANTHLEPWFAGFTLTEPEANLLATEFRNRFSECATFEVRETKSASVAVSAICVVLRQALTMVQIRRMQEWGEAWIDGFRSKPEKEGEAVTEVHRTANVLDVAEGEAGLSVSSEDCDVRVQRLIQHYQQVANDVISDARKYIDLAGGDQSMPAQFLVVEGWEARTRPKDLGPMRWVYPLTGAVIGDKCNLIVQHESKPGQWLAVVYASHLDYVARTSMAILRSKSPVKGCNIQDVLPQWTIDTTEIKDITEL